MSARTWCWPMLRRGRGCPGPPCSRFRRIDTFLTCKLRLGFMCAFTTHANERPRSTSDRRGLFPTDGLSWIVRRRMDVQPIVRFSSRPPARFFPRMILSRASLDGQDHLQLRGRKGGVQYVHHHQVLSNWMCYSESWILPLVFLGRILHLSFSSCLECPPFFFLGTPPSQGSPSDRFPPGERTPPRNQVPPF